MSDPSDSSATDASGTLSPMIVSPPRPIPLEVARATGVVQMDEIDRRELDPRIKLQLLCAEAQEKYGVDPRGRPGGADGFCIVGRPRVILQLLIDIGAGPLSSELRLGRAMVLGSDDITLDSLGRTGADVVGWWREIPVVVRSTTIGDVLRCCSISELRPSHQVDRRQSGVLRLAGQNGWLDRVREREL